MTRQRRNLLQAIIGVGFGIAGCSSYQERESESPQTPTNSPDSTPEAQDIYVVLNNEMSQSVPLSVELTSEGTALLEDQTTIRPSEFADFDTGIDEMGEYTLKVTVEDRVEEGTFDIGEFDLESGSNIIVRIYEDEIQFLTED